jgi:hypothetical protein
MTEEERDTLVEERRMAIQLVAVDGIDAISEAVTVTSRTDVGALAAGSPATQQVIGQLLRHRQRGRRCGRLLHQLDTQRTRRRPDRSKQQDRCIGSQDRCIGSQDRGVGGFRTIRREQLQRNRAQLDRDTRDSCRRPTTSDLDRQSAPPPSSISSSNSAQVRSKNASHSCSVKSLVAFERAKSA